MIHPGTLANGDTMAQDFDVNYKCGRCGKNVEIEGTAMGIQCRHCGSKVFYKKRQSIKKTVISR